MLYLPNWQMAWAETQANLWEPASNCQIPGDISHSGINHKQLFMARAKMSGYMYAWLTMERWMVQIPDQVYEEVDELHKVSVHYV